MDGMIYSFVCTSLKRKEVTWIVETGLDPMQHQTDEWRTVILVWVVIVSSECLGRKDQVEADHVVQDCTIFGEEVLAVIALEML